MAALRWSGSRAARKERTAASRSAARPEAGLCSRCEGAGQGGRAQQRGTATQHAAAVGHGGATWFRLGHGLVPSSRTLSQPRKCAIRRRQASAAGRPSHEREGEPLHGPLAETLPLAAEGTCVSGRPDREMIHGNQHLDHQGPQQAAGRAASSSLRSISTPSRWSSASLPSGRVRSAMWRRGGPRGARSWRRAGTAPRPGTPPAKATGW